MGRKRLAMELISNKRARRTSFQKRKKGLKKAAYELSTLCGVEIGMIIVADDDHEVWPPNWDTVARMTKLHKLGSSQDGKLKTYGVLDYLKEKREEVEEDIRKMREKARERKYATRGDEFESFSVDQLRELGTFLKAKAAAVRETINTRVEQVEQQQILAYNNSYANLGETRYPCLNTQFIMNPYMPEIIQQDQNLAYYEAQNNVGDQNEDMKMMMMMKRDGASCSQGIYDHFDGSQDNYAYLLNESCFQNCGIQTEMMENAANEEEPSMSYEEMLLLNWQGSFPEAQTDYEGFYVLSN